MSLTERTIGDIEELQRRAATERDALRRDRYRAVLLALDGKEAGQIAASLGRARRSVQDWAYAYRDGGIDAIQLRPRPGRTPKLPREQVLVINCSGRGDKDCQEVARLIGK